MFHSCFLSKVDLSKSFKSQVHFFSGSTFEKSDATVVQFNRPSKIDFKQILTEFPNGLSSVISMCFVSW
jgi:hypothetical protein